MLAGCQREIMPKEEAPVAQEPQATAENRAIVKFSEEMLGLIGADLDNGNVVTKSSELNDFVETYGISRISRLFTPNERFAERHRKAGLHQWYVVEYDPAKLPVTRAVETIAALPGIEYAEPDRKIKNNIFNDTEFNKQWHLKQANGVDINVESVWLGYTTGSQNVIVSVVDGGIDLEHPDLKQNTLPGGMGKSRNFVSNNFSIKANDHGTHVAGIIAATSNNELGIAGVAGGDAAAGKPGVVMMSCQIFETVNGETVGGNTADAIVWGADNGAVISQNSWGYTYDVNGDGKLDATELEKAKNDKISASDKAAVDYFIANAGCDENGNQLPNSPMKGGIVFFAAGNDAIEYGAPANYEAVIAVGAIASDGTRSTFSNFGDWLDICAPGTDIYSTVPGGLYEYMSGTSMACPVVSGVAALVLSQRGGVGFTNEMLKECLIKGANTSRISAKRIGPLVDAMGAMAYGMDAQIPEKITEFSTEVLSNSVTVSWNLTSGDNDNPAYGATIYLSKNKASIDNLNPTKPAADVKYINLDTYMQTVGTTVSGGMTGLEFDTEYYITVVPFNYGPTYAEIAPVQKIRTGANNAPVITADVDINNIVLKASQSVNVTFTITEPDNHKFTVFYENTDAETWTQMTADTYVLRINAIYAGDGKHRTSLTVEDEYKVRSTCEVNYEVLSNQAPVCVLALENMLLNIEDKGGSEIDLTAHFSDPDGDQISYSIENTAANVAHVTVNNGKLYATPRGVGKADVTVTAADPRGASVSQTVRILVREDEGGVDIYPTQVTDFLYVGTGEEEAPVEVKVISSAGAEVRNVNTAASIFNPAQIDMNGVAPGVYVVKVLSDGKEYKQNVVKL